MSKPTITAHPGDILMDELNARGIKKMAFARQLQISNSLLSDIIHGKKGMKEEIARKLEEHLSIPVEFWMNAQRNYDFCHEDMLAVRMR